MACPCCGAKVKSPDSLAGKLAICPKCQGIIRVRAAEAAKESSAVANTISAESPPDSCADTVAAHESLPMCEFEPASGPKGPWEALMGLNWLWRLLLAVGCLCLLLSMFSSLVPHLTNIVAVVGILLIAWGYPWWLLLIFNESILQGLLCLCVPGYILWHFSTRYDDFHRPFFVAMTGMLIAMMGVCGGAFRDPPAKSSNPQTVLWRSTLHEPISPKPEAERRRKMCEVLTRK
jgi:hypothetical protein